MVKYIDFDSEGNIFNRINDEKISKDYVPFSNRILLNQWCDSNFDFYCSNGVFVENFFNSNPWQVFTSPPRSKYFWGNDSLKKIERTGYIFGASPFVYSKKIYDKSIKNIEKYQTVFLPKSDNKGKTQLIRKRSLCHKFREKLLTLNLNNPIYIAFPPDYEYYNTFFTNEMKSKLYCLGLDGYSSDWNDKLLELIFYSSELYFNIISTPAIFSSFLNKRVKFYNSDLQYLPEELYKNSFSNYTVDKRLKNSEWHEFMEYITDVFENKTDDLNFWIYNFLSLDKIKSPKDLYEDLLVLHTNFHKETHLLTLNKKNDNMNNIISYNENLKNNQNFLNLKEKVNYFYPKHSETAIYYYEKI